MRRGRPPYPGTLTPREQEVLGLLREGLTNEQIAERLGISFAGAKYHVSEILSKLYVSSREDAASWQPRKRVFGVAFLGVLFKKITPEGILHLTAKTILGAAVGAVALLAIGVGVMALRGDNEETAPDSASNTSPAPTQTAVRVVNTASPSTAAVPAARVSLPRFEVFDSVKSYAVTLSFDGASGEHVEAVVDVEGKNLHAYMTLPALGDVEYVRYDGGTYTKVNGTWTTETVKDVDYGTILQAIVQPHLDEVKLTANSDGVMDNVDGAPCLIVHGTSPIGEGGTQYTVCYADDLPVRFVQSSYNDVLTLTLSKFNEPFNIQRPL